MSYSFKLLTDASIECISIAFNAAFADYKLSFSLTHSQLKNKMHAEDVCLDLSVGVFANNKLIAFILHACRDFSGLKTVYNAATGVIPSERGKNLTSKMYEFVLPELKEKGICKMQHEVLCENYPAIAVYKKAGFVETGRLNCFKGVLTTLPEKANQITVEELNARNWTLFKSFWDFEPAWQNAIETDANLGKDCKLFVALKKDELIGYMLFNQPLNRILQIAVKRNCRRQSAGNKMLNYVSKHYSASVSVINVAEDSFRTNAFFKNAGLKMYIQQYKMEKSFL